jgi:hypothetical protein
MLILTVQTQDGEVSIQMMFNEEDVSVYSIIDVLKGLEQIRPYESYSLMDTNGAFYAITSLLSNKQHVNISKKYKYISQLIILTEDNRAILGLEPPHPISLPIKAKNDVLE